MAEQASVIPPLHQGRQQGVKPTPLYRAKHPLRSHCASSRCQPLRHSHRSFSCDLSKVCRRMLLGSSWRPTHSATRWSIVHPCSGRCACRSRGRGARRRGEYDFLHGGFSI